MAVAGLPKLKLLPIRLYPSMAQLVLAGKMV